MLYSGIFRSLDQSVDPKGQLYKVLIFTGYNPNDRNAIVIGEDERSTNVGPYPTKRIRVGMDLLTRVYRYVPDIDSVVNLTMTDHPFTVEYSGDTDNVHKPYRCSTATVSFLQENLNTNFINSIGNGVMVMLLKWKNEVVQQGDFMVNTITSAILPITDYIYDDPTTGRQNRYFHDFLPWKYDKFCYDVEWIGFATPEMLNVEYDHITDRFSLNCQDALSTLQYENFERTDQLETIQETLFKMLYKLGTYKDVYITNSVHFNSVTNSLYTIPLAGSAMKHIVHQQDNFIDEDGEPDKYLEILEKMMDYLSLTAIPYKDSLWIVSNEGLAMGHTTYRHYNMEISSRLWILPAEIALGSSYTDMGDVDISDTTILNGDSFCGGTDLSSNIIYNKVKVVCDEMRPEPLLPDFSDTRNFLEENSSMNQPMAEYVFDGMVTNPTNIHLFEGYFNRSAIDEIKFFRYPSTPGWSPHGSTFPAWQDPTVNWGYEQLEVADEDLHITNHVYSGGNNLYYNLLDGVTKIQAWSDQQYWSYMSNMSIISDYSVSQASSLTDLPSGLNFSRGIMLITPLNWNQSRKHTQYEWTGAYDLDDKSIYWNPMLYVKSKPFLGNGKQYLNIDASFIYSHSGSDRRADNWIPAPIGQSAAGYFKFDNDHNYVWAKIKLGNRYLTDSGRGNYSWGTVESYVRLWCGNEGLAQDADYRNKTFNTETTHRGIDGICVKLPINEGYAAPYQLEIWIDRPLGPGSTSSWCPTSTIIEDFNINIYSTEYVESRKRRNPDRDNTEYSNPILEGAIEERPEVSLNHSSCDTAGLSYSETARKEVFSSKPSSIITRYTTNPQVFNEGAGHYGLPEQVKIESLRNQGITPTVVMKTQVFNNIITPISRVFWSWLSNKQFIVDSMSIDYEYEQCDANLVEMKQPSDESISIERVNSTRNLYRTRDIIFNGHIARRNVGTLQPATPINSGVNNPANTDTPVVLSTNDDMAGNSSLNVDWTTGQARLSTSPISGVSASNNNGQVVIKI